MGANVKGDKTLTSNVRNSIGSVFHVDIERGGAPMSFDIAVQDLHSITPARYLSAGGSKFNDLSYQLARQFAVPVSGVYVSEMGGMFKVENDESGWIISSLNAIPTPNLDAFIEAFKTLADGDQVPMTYYSIGDVHTKNMSVINVDRHWSSFRIAARNDKTGFWDFTDIDSKPLKKVHSPVTVSFPVLDPSLGNVKNVFQSLVKVKMSMPFRIEGYPKSRVCFALIDTFLNLPWANVYLCRNKVPVSF